MSEGEARTGTPTIRPTIILVGLLLLAVILLTPVKGWLNQIPYIWHVLYPLLTLFAGYLVVSATQSSENPLAIGKWAILLIAAACASIHVLFDVPRIFFTLSRAGAIVFIAAEVAHSLLESLADGVDQEPA